MKKNMTDTEEFKINEYMFVDLKITCAFQTLFKSSELY